MPRKCVSARTNRVRSFSEVVRATTPIDGFPGSLAEQRKHKDARSIELVGKMAVMVAAVPTQGQIALSQTTSLRVHSGRPTAFTRIALAVLGRKAAL